MSLIDVVAALDVSKRSSPPLAQALFGNDVTDRDLQGFYIG